MLIFVYNVLLYFHIDPFQYFDFINWIMDLVI